MVRIGGVDVALTICEDMWQAGGPFAAARRAGVGLVVTVNGSPYELDKDDVRLPLVQRRAAEAGATVAYVNMVGGQDELVFDGDSMIVTAAGELLARAPQFAEELLIHDLDLPAGLLPPPPSVPARRGRRSGRPRRHGDRAGGGVGVGSCRSPGRLASGPAIAERLADEAEVWAALVLGLRDYVRKNGFRRSCSASPAASTRRWSPRSRSTPSARPR